MKKSCFLPGLLCIFPLLAFAQDTTRVLIVYYSVQGHTRQMAESVAAGARSVNGVQVTLLLVHQAKNAHVLQADAIIVGSPVYNANTAPQMQAFINQWPFQGAPLRDKIGAAFVIAGGISAGEELTQLNLLHSLLVFGMIIVGGPDWQSAFGASGVTEEHFPGEVPDKSLVHPHFLAKGRALGKRVAQVAKRFRCGGNASFE